MLVVVGGSAGGSSMLVAIRDFNIVFFGQTDNK